VGTSTQFVLLPGLNQQYASTAMSVETLLFIIIVLLITISLQLRNINERLKKRFPTEKEQDYEWAKRDPIGHWEAHRDDKKKNASG